MISNDIGTNAGNIYMLLSQRGSLTLRKIGELTHRKESVIFLSLGWLLRENKINVSERNGEWFYELKQEINNTYC